MHPAFTTPKTYFGPYSLKDLALGEGHESVAFEATLLREGKPLARVRNEGRGGFHVFTWKRARRDHRADLFDFVAAKPPTDHSQGSETLTADAVLTLEVDLFINRLVEWTEFCQDHAHKLEKTIFYQVGRKPPEKDDDPFPRPEPDQPFLDGGTFGTAPGPYTPARAEALRASLAEKYPGQPVRILNEEVA